MISDISDFDTPSPNRVIAGLPDYPAIKELQQHKQWVAWKYEMNDQRKLTKIPVNPHTGRNGSTSDSSSWGSYEQALDRANSNKLAGVGFVLSEDDNLTGYDFDKCRHPKSGKIKPWAREILDLHETYAEVTPSGTGVRLFARGKIVSALKYDPAKTEVYAHGRYLTITGRHVDGTPDRINDAPLTRAACRARVKLHQETWAKLKKAGPSLTLEVLKTPGLVAQKLDFNNAPLQRRRGPAPSAPAPKPDGIISHALAARGQEAKDPFWENVNRAAMDNLAQWAPTLLPAGRWESTGAWRVSSADLGRDLEEDLSIHPNGIVDWGIDDVGTVGVGQKRAGGRRPIDLVMKHGHHAKAADAAHWLCHQMGIWPESLGWRGAQNTDNVATQAAAGAGRKPELLSSSAFIQNYVPPNYLIDGILQRRYCYSLTAPTGTGKTALLLYMISCVARGLSLGHHSTEAGAVCFFAGENPDDVRSRWMALAEHAGFDLDKIDVYFIEGVFPLAEIKGVVERRAKELGVEFSMIVVDTSAAYDLGDDENSNAQMKKHARTLRSLVELPGGPTVIAACHPAKNADPDNLLPRGGGAFVAEVDGNLVCKKSGEVVEMHWQGKFRGVDFSPVPFQIDIVTADKLRDYKNRLIPTVVAKTISDAEHGAIVKRDRNDEDELIVLLHEGGNPSISEMAERLGWSLKTGKSFGEPHKTKVVRVLERLRAEGLAKRKRGRHVLTGEGEKLAKELV